MSDENSHPPKADSPTYRRWFPAASALPDDDLIPTTGEFRNGFVNYATPATLGHDVVGFDNTDVHFYQKPYLDYFGIDYESFEQVIGMFELSSTYVLVGDIDPSTVADTLLDSGYSEASSYGDYSLFDRDDEPRTAAVTDGTIVWARHPESTALVKAVIDAGSGDVQRHHEANEAFALATDAIGTRPWIHVGGLGVDPTGEALIRSLSYTFNEKDIFYLHHTLYPDGQTITDQEVKDALNQNTRGRSAWAVDIQIEDRLLTVEMGLAPSQRPTDYSDVTVPRSRGESITVMAKSRFVTKQATRRPQRRLHCMPSRAESNLPWMASFRTGTTPSSPVTRLHSQNQRRT